MELEQYLIDIKGKQAILEIELIKLVQPQFKATGYMIPDKGELFIFYSPGKDPLLENSISKITIEGNKKLILVKDKILSKCITLTFGTWLYNDCTLRKKDYYTVELYND